MNTARLMLVPASLEHLDLFCNLNSSAVVMRFVTGRPSWAAEVESEWVRRLGARTDAVRGLGYWVGFVGD